MKKEMSDTNKKVQGISNIKNIILVASGKGGVGKSVVSCNLAAALMKLGYKTGLLDADIYGPSIPIMFGIKKGIKIKAISAENDSVIMMPIKKYGIKLMSIGFLTDPSSAIIWRSPMIVSAFMQMINQVFWGNLDYLIIDLPPGTGDIQLTISQQISVSGSIIVSTPQDVVFADVVRAKSMFDKVNIKLFGIVENMSFFVCDNCNKRHNVFSYDKVKKNIKELGIDFFTNIPINSKISESSDYGKPYVLDNCDDLSKIFLNLAEDLNRKIEKFPRINNSFINLNKIQDKTILPVI